MIDAPNQAHPGTWSSAALRVSDVMGPVVTVAPDATLREIAQLMLQQQVQAVLVVDEQTHAIGIVTDRQLVCDDRHLTVDAACAAATSLCVRDLMEKRQLCVDVKTQILYVDRPGATWRDLERLGAVVQRMNRREEEIAVVHNGGNVVGLLGRRDLLRRVAGEPIVTQDPSALPHVTLGDGRKSWIAWLTGASWY